MKVKPIYHNGFVNYLHTPESDEEHAAMVEMAVRSEQAEAMQKAMQELCEKLEGEIINGNLQRKR